MTETIEYPPVRALTRKDRIKLSELIEKFAERSDNKNLTSMLPGSKKSKAKKNKNGKAEDEDTSGEVYELIKAVLKGVLKWVEADVTDWFMDLIGVTDREEYDNMPFDIEMHIIQGLIDQKGFTGFFMQASALYKKIRG